MWVCQEGEYYHDDEVLGHERHAADSRGIASPTHPRTNMIFFKNKINLKKLAHIAAAPIGCGAGCRNTRRRPHRETGVCAAAAASFAARIRQRQCRESSAARRRRQGIFINKKKKKQHGTITKTRMAHVRGNAAEQGLGRRLGERRLGGRRAAVARSGRRTLVDIASKDLRIVGERERERGCQSGGGQTV